MPLISREEVQHVAKLARIALAPEEVDAYQRELESILGHMEKLKEVNTEGVPPTTHPLDLSNAWRDDVARPFPDIPALFKNAPEVEGGFFKVKKVLE